MKKLIFIFLILPSFSFAEGPILKQKDPIVQQEFENAYQDIRGKTSYLTNGTSGQILISQGVGTNPIWSFSGRVLQTVYAQISASSSTTSASFVNSSLTASITPLQSGSTMTITINGSLQSAAGDQSFLTINRGNTDVAGGTNAVIRQISPAASAIQAGCSFTMMDNPATTTSTTYTLRMKSGTGGQTTQFCDGVCNMIIVEYGK